MALTSERVAYIEEDARQNRPGVCTRCGQEIAGYVMEARRRRESTNTQCSDCNAGVRYWETHGDLICKPWTGEVDLDTFQPLDKAGQPYMPGPRRCGRADCVNSSHVLSDEVLIAEQFSTYYRTGKKLNYKQLVKEVRKEGRQ